MTESNANPVAFGYVRAQEPNEHEISLLRKEIAEVCAVKKYRLATIYCDRGCDGSELARPGFAGLLDALALPDSTAFVIPDVTHLSTDAGVRQTLLYQLRRTGARLLVVHDTAGQHEDGVSSGQDEKGKPA